MYLLMTWLTLPQPLHSLTWTPPLCCLEPSPSWVSTLLWTLLTPPQGSWTPTSLEPSTTTLPEVFRRSSRYGFQFNYFIIVRGFIPTIKQKLRLHLGLTLGEDIHSKTLKSVSYDYYSLATLLYSVKTVLFVGIYPTFVLTYLISKWFFRTTNPFRILLLSWVWMNCQKKISWQSLGPGKSKGFCPSPSRLPRCSLDILANLYHSKKPLRYALFYLTITLKYLLHSFEVEGISFYIRLCESS